MAKTVLQFCRVLVTDDFVTRIEVRSAEELSKFWQFNHGAYSIVIIIGHTTNDHKVVFAVDGDKNPIEFGKIFDANMLKSKGFLFLVCETGKKVFSKEFSKSKCCQYLIAPTNKIHGAEAAVFCQLYLTRHFLNGQTNSVAFKHTEWQLPSNSYRMWKSGRLKYGYRAK